MLVASPKDSIVFFYIYAIRCLSIFYICMRVFEQLKKLRRHHNLTLKELSSKIGYGTGNLSSYENGKLQAKDPTLLRILTRGYQMSKAQAQEQLAQWRLEEVQEHYGIHDLAQPKVAYESGSIEEQLVKNGLNKNQVQQVLKLIEKIKRQNHVRSAKKD